MKKILVVVAMICFVAVNVSIAQTPAPVAKETKKETVDTKATVNSTSSSCNHNAAKACCKKSSMKACTPEEKAKCAEKAKAEASTKAEAPAKN